ncbi:hypothetical protein GQ43DRAFT_440861 [Delitschia confertaspora ATCC 74209]|uniref:DUF788 domain protein n=1 Tax=Delitschia confertaspora ATCC 74209 TaxID=1513339 RepID=A0A9P4MVH9_9PLEO|nr:hypothetical protein GQ43DRAFT_440861 [Delitschia confertaspora ATCC 74209]
MAQKAAKTLAARNTTILNRTALLTALFHGLFWFLRALLFRSSFTRKSIILYILLSAPQLVINWQFERNGRPLYARPGDLKKSGDDLEAKGLTEYMWDVTYWTYGCLALVALLGDWAWWFWLVIPIYSVWSLYTTFMGARQGFTQDAAGVPQPATSKRQAKLEKRGGQQVRYR